MSAAATPEGKLPAIKPLQKSYFSSPGWSLSYNKQPLTTSNASLAISAILNISAWLLLTYLTVLWAQRSNKTDAAKNFIYLTISVPDVQPSKLKLELKPQSLKFAGHSDSLKRDYHLELEFYAEIDEKESKINHTAKNIEIVLRKKELKEEFWPRLLKDAKKVHFLKTDFDKWVDEDEQDEAPEDDLGSMGGMGKSSHVPNL
jgi:hypothetical protein